MKEFKFYDIYSLVSLIDQSVDYDEGFCNHDENYFINASTKFSKQTLLHQYIVTRGFNYYHRHFRKNGDCFDEEEVEHWQSLFKNYDVEIRDIDFENDEEPVKWMEKNEDEFLDLFERMGEEVFHILFSNRNFLLKFNQVVADTVKETEFPQDLLTKKGKISRRHVPKWVQNAVFYRDKGRCVYCNTDLTCLVNTLTQKNLDHMVPLDLFGTNDPCNLQLACESCNKRKSNTIASTSHKYHPWWSG